MRKPEQAAEPSIEEILASIRRIIADDAPQSAAVADDMGETRLQAYAGERRIRAVEPAPRAPEQRERGGEDEVLELTEDFMLAEEASAVELREPAEPDEVMTAAEFDSRFSSQAYDPYDDQASAQTAEPEATADSVAEPAEEPAPSPTKGLASVMAEVQRFTGFGRSAEPKPAAGTSESAQPQTAEEPTDPTAAASWGQPGFDMLGTDAAPRPPAPRWSARSKVNEAAKPNEPQAPARPAARLDTPPARDASQRKPAFGGRDSWSEGVQMPVPQEGPAMPFGVEETADLPPLPPLGPSAATPQKPSMPASEAAEGGDVGKAFAAGLQLRAEQLAAQAVADFASDRLSTVSGKPVVTDILKSDRPLMDEITSTLADALSKTDDDAQEFEDAAPPMEDLVDEGLAAEPAAPSAPVQGKAGLQDMMGMQPLNLDGGFVAGQPVAGLPKTPSILADQDTPELPRDEGDDLGPMPDAFPGIVPTYSSPASLEPSMPQMSMPPARMTMQPAPSVSGGTSVERLQPSMAGVKSLEETVREMLKPLLVQWLNENMPRIINDVLRQEMASSGLLPGLGKDRR